MKLLKWLICLVIVIYSASGSVNFKWTPGSGGGPAHHFELVLIRDVTLTEYWYATPDNRTNVTVEKPKSGRYELRIRAVNYGPIGQPQKSEWCSSLDESCSILKDGSPGAWKVMFKPSDIPGPIIITPKSSMWMNRTLMDKNFAGVNIS